MFNRDVTTRWIRAAAGLALLLALVVSPIWRSGAAEGWFRHPGADRITPRPRYARSSHLSVRLVAVLRQRLKAVRSPKVEQVGGRALALRVPLDSQFAASLFKRQSTSFHPALVTRPLRC